MAVNKSLVSFIKSPNLKVLKSVVLVYGNEDYLKYQFVQSLKKIYKDINVLWGDEIELNNLISNFSSNSLFVSENIVILKNFEDFIKKLKKDELKNFLDFCIKLSKNDRLILISNLDKLPSKEPYKTLKSAADILSASSPTIKKFIASLKNKFISEGIEISDELLEYLAKLLKNDLFYTKQEVEKLILYTKEKGKITKEDIDKIVYPKLEENIFSFIHKFFIKDREAINIVRNLLDIGYHPFEIQSLILNQLNRLLLYKSLKDKKSEKQIFLELGLKYPFQISQLKEEDKKVSKDELINLVKDLYQLEIEQKIFYKEANKSLEDLVVNFITK